MRKNSLRQLPDFLTRLKARRIYHAPECARGEALMLMVAVPGGRGDVEFFPDGHGEVEVFEGTAARPSPGRGPGGEAALERLFR